MSESYLKMMGLDDDRVNYQKKGFTRSLYKEIERHFEKNGFGGRNGFGNSGLTNSGAFLAQLGQYNESERVNKEKEEKKKEKKKKKQ